MVVVAACQVPVDIDDPVKTRRIVAEAVAEAAGRGAALVVLPELDRLRLDRGVTSRSRARGPSR